MSNNLTTCQIDCERLSRSSGNITDFSFVSVPDGFRETKAQRKQNVASFETLYRANELGATIRRESPTEAEEIEMIADSRYTLDDIVKQKGASPVGIILGFVGDQRISDIVSRPGISVREESSNGQTLFVYEGVFREKDNKEIDIQLFFNPMYEGAVSKVNVSTVYTPDTLGDWFSREGIKPEDYPVLREIVSIVNNDFQEMSRGIWCPKSTSCSITTFPRFVLSSERDSTGLKSKIARDDSGKPVLMGPSTVVNTVAIKHIEFSPPIAKKKLSWTVDPPNGTNVFMRDAPQIQYIWFDGKIVPKTDEAMLAVARGNHKFMPGPDEPRFWLMAIGIILILIGGGKMTYDHFFKNKDDEDMP